MGIGGDGGIRTLDRALQPYNGLANRRLQPLGHVSKHSIESRRPMPDQRRGCKDFAPTILTAYRAAPHVRPERNKRGAFRLPRLDRAFEY